jgi:hypothetical protein
MIALRYDKSESMATQYGDATNISIPVTLGYKIKPLKRFYCCI